MSLHMTELEVRLPERRCASSFSSGKKPMAEVSCILENGRVREIVVPVRVGKLLMQDAIALPLEEEEAFDAIHALEGRVCFTILTEMLNRRDYSIAEAKSKLVCHGFRDIEIDQAVSRAVDARFLDDARFTSCFIDERKRRGWGRRKIEMELKRRGVDPFNLVGYPEDFFSDDDDLERASAILRRKTIPDVRGYEKLVRHLLGKGFSYPTASEAVKLRLSSEDRSDF